MLEKSAQVPMRPVHVALAIALVAAVAPVARTASLLNVCTDLNMGQTEGADDVMSRGVVSSCVRLPAPPSVPAVACCAASCCDACITRRPVHLLPGCGVILELLLFGVGTHARCDGVVMRGIADSLRLHGPAIPQRRSQTPDALSIT